LSIIEASIADQGFVTARIDIYAVATVRVAAVADQRVVVGQGEELRAIDSVRQTAVVGKLVVRGPIERDAHIVFGAAVVTQDDEGRRIDQYSIRVP